MKRPLNFRIWMSAEGAFRYWTPLSLGAVIDWDASQKLTDNGNGEVHVDSRYEAEDSEQWTGLSDDTDLDIYEGDLLRAPLSIMGGPDIDWTGQVIWDNAFARFVAKSERGDCRELPLARCEVVGNIHEVKP